MIQIYGSANTNFSSNGDMVLFPTICEANSNILGTWYLSMNHPKDEEGRWKEITEEAVLSVPTFLGKNQLFRIKTVDKSEFEVTVTAYPIFYDSADELFLYDVRPTNASGQEALNAMLDGSKFTGESDIATRATAYFENRNFMDSLNGDTSPTFIQRWGGEILYNNFCIAVKERIGSDNGAEVRYGKNMEHINYHVDMSEICTRIIPVAYNGRKYSGTYVDSDNINKYAKIYHRKMKFEEVRLSEDVGEDVDGYIVCENQEELDAVLLEKCREQFALGLDLPKVTISVDMIMLANTEEYKDFAEIENISLGDTVKCYNKDLGISTSARAIELVWDCIEDCAKKAVLGDYEYSYFSQVNSTINRIEGTIRPDGTVVAERVKGILDASETSLNLQSSAAKKVSGRAFLIEDTDKESDLYGAMEAGTQGLRIAKTKDAENKWVWETAITAAGIVANAIITGLLSDKTGENYWNLDTGEFKLSSTTLIGDKTVGEIEDIVGKVEDGVEGNYFYIRYSADADGAQMTEEPADDTKYIGVCNTSSETAPTDPAEYDWVLVKGKDGTNGTPGTNGEDGKTSYLHIKYSDDGKTFTKNFLSADINDWIGGQPDFGTGKTIDFNVEEAGDSLTWKSAISVKEGEEYTIKTGHTRMYIVLVTYDNDGNYIRQIATGKATYTYTVPSGVGYIVVYVFATGGASTETYSTYEELAAGFDGGEIVPTMYKSDNVLGEELGAYIGTYVDFTEADSTKFSDYTWKKFTEDVDEELKEIRTSIEKNAENIKLCVTQTDYTGEKIVSLINLSPETVKIAAALIALEGVVTANGSFKILTDGSAEATNLTVEKEIFTDILNVNSINNGQYQKTLTSSPTLYVNTASGDDDQECINGAVFKTLQGAVNSIPKFMNGKNVYIELQTDSVENVSVNFFSSGRIYIYLAGHTLFGYIYSTVCPQLGVYGGTKSGGGTDMTGIIHPSKGINLGGYTASFGLNYEATAYISNLKIFGADNLLSDTSNRACVAVQQSAHLYAIDIEILNTQIGFRANAAGRIFCSASSGVASIYGFYATSGGSIMLNSARQAGGTSKNVYENNGGTVKYHTPTHDTGSASSSSSTADTTTVQKSVIYTADKGNSVQKYGSASAYWRSDNTPKVGEWDGNGDHVAFWFFGDDFENIAHKNVNKIEITFTRNRGGNSAATTHNFYAHSYESQPSTVKPEYYTTKIGSASVATYSTGKVTITDSNLINAIKSRKGICSIPPAQSSAYYSVMSGAMKVKFYYTE